MTRNIRNIILLCLLLAPITVFAQPYKTIKIWKPYNWMFGIHWNVVEDDGDKFGNLFNVSDSWNYLLFPTKVTADKYFKYGWSLEMAASYNKLSRGKTINDSTDVESHFICFDVNGKYSFYTKYYPRASWIDPYLMFGLGYTYRQGNASNHVPTLNLGLGINFWIKNFGIQIHSNAKGGLWPGFWDMDNHDNYLQHSLGIVYRVTDPAHTNGYFSKPKSKWALKSQRYKKKKGH